MSVVKRELFNVWCQGTSIDEKNNAVLTFVLNKYHLNDQEASNIYHSVKEKVRNFNVSVNKMWQCCTRTRNKFETKHRDWLNTTIDFFDIQSHFDQSIPSTSRGRPCKSFEDLGDQRKRQKIMPLVTEHSLSELTFATRKSLELSGQRTASKIIKEVAALKVKDASKIKKALDSPPSKYIKYTPEEALSLFIDGRLSKKSYVLMQQGAKRRNANIYPNYNILLAAKKKCFPEKKFIKVNDVLAEVELQALVDHTSQRIYESQKEVFQSLPESSSKKFTIQYKWGCDGSGGHSTYKQQFNDEDATKTDANLFSICLVPLQMTADDDGTVLWQNPRPSSVRYCRPLKLIFAKETPDLSKTEIAKIEEQIKNIKPTITDDRQLIINHNLKLTMIDGKMFSVISNSSTQTCGICGATPKVMNDLEKIFDLPIEEKFYDYGISTLHAWIRCLECCLHISYKLVVQKWQVREPNEKNMVKNRRDEVIQKLKEHLHLLVDIPKQGFGTTNDGNTARRFFRNYGITANITGICIFKIFNINKPILFFRS